MPTRQKPRTRSQSFDREQALKELFGEAPDKSVIEQKIESLMLKYSCQERVLEQICEETHLPHILHSARELREHTRDELQDLSRIVERNHTCETKKGA